MIHKKSISLEIFGFHIFLQNEIYFSDSYGENFMLLSQNPYWNDEMKLLEPRCADHEIFI